LHDELITLLIAGYETTATAIAWAGFERKIKSFLNIDLRFSRFLMN